LSVLYYGEVRPCLEVVRANSKKAGRGGKVVGGGVRMKKAKLKCASLNRLVQRKKTESREKKASSKVSPVHYRTFIISNSIEYRRWLKPDSTPERQLQKIAKGVYGSILLSLLNARPLFQSKPQEVGGCVVEDAYLEKLERLTTCWVFPQTLSLLVAALEDLLHVSTSTGSGSSTCHSQNKPDLLTTLSFWHEINEVLATPTASHSDTPLCLDNIPQVTSTECCRILVDHLLSPAKISPAVWQASLTNLLSGLQHRMDLFTDYDKFLSMLVRFFGSSSCVTVSGLVPRIVGVMLGCDQRMVSERKGGVSLSGDCLLLEVIIVSLQER
jgi:hypothetical protein